MGKGRLLTVEEINNLKDGQSAWVEFDGVGISASATGKYTLDNKVFRKEKTWFCMPFKVAKIYEYIEEPKTYEIDEVIKMFKENPKLKFKGALGAEVFMDSNGGVCSVSDNVRLNSYVMKCRWTLVKPEPKEVTFLEAVEACNKGKTIKCIYLRDTTTYKGQLYLIDQKERPIDCCEILYGEWYVED